MSGMLTPQEAARREAHEACPCRAVDLECTCGDGDSDSCAYRYTCKCWISRIERDTPNTLAASLKTARECTWPGHAAIDRAIRVATLAGKVEQAEKDITILSEAPPAWMPKLRADRDRLRAEFEKEVKGGM